MELDYRDLTNNDLCKLHSTYLQNRNQYPELTHNQLSINTSHPSFIYLPYGGNIQTNYCRINQLSNNNINNEKSTEYPFERKNLFCCNRNILREKNSPECSYSPIGWQNNISQCEYNARCVPNRSYGYEQNRFNARNTEAKFNTQTNCNSQTNCNIQNTNFNTQNESRNTEESNFRPTNESPAISQELLRISKPDIRTGTDNYNNFQKIVNNQPHSYGRRDTLTPRKPNSNERNFQKNYITGERFPITKRPAEYNQYQRNYERNSPPETNQIQEKIKFNKTIMQNGCKQPRIQQQQQENYVGGTGRSSFNRYCNPGNEIGQIMSEYRKSIKEELSKIDKGSFPYETEYSNPIYTQNCRRLQELQEFGRKNNEKIDCSCCCNINNNNNNNNQHNNNNNKHNINQHNNSYDNFNPLVNSLNQFRNKMEQRLLCHKHCSDSDRASDDEFNTLLMNRCNSGRGNNNIHSSAVQTNNNEGEMLSSINENSLWKNGHNISQEQECTQNNRKLLTPHNSNCNDRIYSSNPNSSDDENSRKYRRSILQGPRGEGGRLLIPTNSNYGYSSTDDENIYNKLPSTIDEKRGKRFIKPIDRHAHTRDTSPYPMSSDDEHSVKSHRSILQCARGEGGKFLKSNSLEPITKKRSTTNIFSSDDETILTPRRSFLLGPRGEGGRILRPTNTNNYTSCRNYKSNISSSEDEYIYNPLIGMKPYSKLLPYCNNKLRSHPINLHRSYRTHDIFPNNFNITKPHNRNFSSSEDETYKKIVPRILEGHRNRRQLLDKNNFNIFGNNRNRTSHQLSAGDSVTHGPILGGSYNNSSNDCSSCESHRRQNSASNFNPVHRVALSPRRSILQSQRSEGGQFLKRNDSHASGNGYNINLRTLCMDTDDNAKKKIKFNSDILPQKKLSKKGSSSSATSYKNFTKNFNLPCCQAIDKKTEKTEKLYPAILNNRRMSSFSAPVQSINPRLIPIRRTNSSSPNQIRNTTTLTTATGLSSNKRTTNISRPLSTNIKKNNQTKTDQNNFGQTIFRYINELEELKSNYNRGIQNKKLCGDNNGSKNTRKTIPLKKNDMKSNCGSIYKGGTLGKSISEPKKFNVTSKVTRINSLPFKYKQAR